MNQSINNHCKNCNSILKLLLKNNRFFCEIGRTCPFTENPEPLEIIIEIPPTPKRIYQSTKNYIKTCPNCFGSMEVIPASEHFSGKEKNKCTSCHLIDNSLE